MDELLIVDTRTASDGSFILFDNDVNYYLDTFPALIANHQRFTNAPLKTIEEIVKIYQQAQRWYIYRLVKLLVFFN